MGLDDRLLSAQNNQAESQDETSADRAGALSEAKRRQQDSASQESDEESSSLRQTVQKEKSKKSKKNAKKKSSGSALAPPSPIFEATSRLLRQSWIHIIDSYGSTLFWINIHAFLNKVFGHSIFCNLGDEWVHVQTMHIDVKGKVTFGKEKKQVNKSIELVEGMGLGCVDLGCLFSCLFQLALISMIVGFISSPLKALAEILKGVFSNWLSLK